MNKVSITINSRRYNVVAEESVEYLEALAEHVNEKVETVLSSGSNVMGERPLVLAALNICDEYFKVNEAGFLIKEQLQRCNDKLEDQIAENKKLLARISALEEELNDSQSGQISIDAEAAEKKDLEDRLFKAENEVKYFKGQLEFAKKNQNKNG